jgi:hypothetical protein
MSPFAIFVRTMIVIIWSFLAIGIGLSIFFVIRNAKKGIRLMHDRSRKFEMFSSQLFGGVSALGGVQHQFVSPDDKRFQTQTSGEYQHQQVSPDDVRFNDAAN